jgi:RHS repeat-associated protein
LENLTSTFALFWEVCGRVGNKTITFLYDAGGNKLRKTVVNNGVVQYVQNYVGGIEYRNNILESIFHSEGRITTIGSALKYEYALKDHLGNTRVMFSDRNNNGQVDVDTEMPNSIYNDMTQENHYYAFGMNMEGVWLNNTSLVDNRYQYNGKELNEDFGLNWNDYGARFYDAAIGRWNVVDPLAEKYYSWSAYNYVKNNPTNYTDPNGMQVDGDFHDQNGVYIGSDGKKDGKVYIQKTSEKEFVDGKTNVPGAGLSEEDRSSSEAFIVNNNGKSSKFDADSKVYNSFIEVESSAENRSAMAQNASQDNGKGGKSDANNREYSGGMVDGKYTPNKPGPVSSPDKGAETSGGNNLDHSHPSVASTKS